MDEGGRSQLKRRSRHPAGFAFFVFRQEEMLDNLGAISYFYKGFNKWRKLMKDKKSGFGLFCA
jgi:hypothetical protein